MTLSAKQLQGVVLLARGKSAKETAETLEVTVQTISQWRKADEFTIELNRLKTEIVNSGRDAIRCAAQDAVDCLKSLVKSGSSEEVRRKAAINILEMSGIADPSDGRFRFGIGPASTSEMEDQKAKAEFLESLKLPRINKAGI